MLSQDAITVAAAMPAKPITKKKPTLSSVFTTMLTTAKRNGVLVSSWAK